MSDIYFEENRHLSFIIGYIDRLISCINIDKKTYEERIYRELKYMREELPSLILSQEDASELARQNSVILHIEDSLYEKIKRREILTRMRGSPYFGRIDFEEEGGDKREIYIGIANLTDETDFSTLICDWRAPVASLFYERGTGETSYDSPDGVVRGRVSLLRQYKIENSQLLYLVDSDIKIDDTLLMSALSKNSSDHMRAIVSTIQREQNSVIRDGVNELLIVLGPAGSGKTNIALHRIAYLLYRDRNTLKNRNILIFSPNKVFSEYISDVVPELGEREIPEATFRDLIVKNCGVQVSDAFEQFEYLCSEKGADPSDRRRYWISLKSSAGFLAFVKDYAKNYVPDFRDVVFNGTVIVSAEELSELFVHRFAHMSIALRLEAIQNEITQRLAPHKQTYRAEIAKQLAGIYTDEDQLRIKTRLAFDDAAKAALEAISHNVNIDWAGVCRQILCLYVAENEPDSEFRDRLLDDVAEFSPDKKLSYEDGIFLLLVKVCFGAVSPLKQVRHVVIDEVQDYSPPQHEIFARLFPHAHLTLLGDAAQVLNPLSGLSSAKSVRDYYPQSPAEIKYLSKSYRCTSEIFNFASVILGSADRSTSFERHGKRVRLITEPSPRLLATRICELIAESDSGISEDAVSTAIITKTAAECRQTYQRLRPLMHSLTMLDSEDCSYIKGNIILPLALAKGLEFDRVFVSNSALYTSESDRMLLYIACTRAMHELTVCSVGKPSPFIGESPPKQ